ncbi:MAG TPA: hypothetical protein VHP82_09465 [Gaiellaceae bacterium]|jgi:hypothetical protein|nr:hypothetical protein [Gaiellaceae bacterium]
MSPRAALGAAGRDLFRNSWRLVPVNAALGVVLVAVAVLTAAVHAALVLAVLAGPIAAALVHCSVKLVRTENVALADAREGLRLHWRRGLQLGAAGTALVVLAIVAVRFYARSPFGWPFAFLTVYLLVLLGVYAVVLATYAIAEPERPLRLVAREAAALGARRPGATLLLGLALLMVNLAGVAAAVMPFLTLTVAYSFVAVAHFALDKES